MASKKDKLEKTKKAGKVYGYCRISTTAQDADRQQKDIFEYAAKHGMLAPEIITETISSRKQDREVFALVDRLEVNDILIVTELSRLCRSMIELNGIIASVLKKGAAIHVVTGKPVDESIESQCMVFAIGLAAQIERDMISERTTSALKAKKAEGVKLGRPEGKGRKVGDALVAKGLTAEYIIGMANAGLSASKIGELIGVKDARTVAAWLKSNGQN